jgi:diphthamide synthase (EF-2-diphthine--ammonia ligase)
MKVCFRFWKENPKDIINEFIDSGFKAIIVCANAAKWIKVFVGREITKELINELPSNVDVCGENGEFHTFVYDGPIFCTPIKFNAGEIVLKHYPFCRWFSRYGFLFFRRKSCLAYLK